MNRTIKTLIFLILSSGFISGQKGLKPEPIFSRNPSEALTPNPKVNLPSESVNRLQEGVFEPKELPAQSIRNLLQADVRDTLGNSLILPRWMEVDISALGRNGIIPEKPMDVLKNVLFDYGLDKIDLSLSDEYVDEFNIMHQSYIPFFNGHKIFPGILKFHIYSDKYLIHGDLRQPSESLQSKLSESDALSVVMDKYGHLAPKARNAIDGDWFDKSPETVYYLDPRSRRWHLAYHIDAHPSGATRYEVLVDAQNGEFLMEVNSICSSGSCLRDHLEPGSCLSDELDIRNANELSPSGGPEVSFGNDLNGVRRTLQVFGENGTQFMVDATKPMFRLTSGVLTNPTGAIATSDFRNGIFRSTNNTWQPSAVSAHFFAAQSYDYFLNTHGRNSFDGNGATILSFTNVPDPESGSLRFDNAFWNGRFLSFGNGDVAFLKPLSGALDVVAHELSHGVVEKTANLIYQDESGALNESFSDIFGVMVDRDDWGLAEDIVNRNVFRGGFMRNMQDPHNGVSNGQNGFQPKHVREQFRGTFDNGGVHINSGIPNHAFFLFTQAVGQGNEENGKRIAEKVFFRALRNYLTRSSNFKDLRLAVEQAIKDLHPNDALILNAARSAFDQVGIDGPSGGGGGPTNHQKDLAANAGPQYVIVIGNNNAGINLLEISTNRILRISNQTVISKPSASDNGAIIVFVNGSKQLIALILNSQGFYEEVVVDDQPIYRNVVVSKHGDLLAFLLDQLENKVHVFDIQKNLVKTFDLINPNTSGGFTSNVKYADFMDFDHTGEVLMYDCLSKSNRPDWSAIDYWDIGFIDVYNRQTRTFGEGAIVKLFQDLPENISIGNPVFSKNSPYIIAFDLLDSRNGAVDHSIVGANIETSNLQTLASGLPDLGYPNYSVDDKKLIFDNQTSISSARLFSLNLQSDKIRPNGVPSVFINNGHWGHWMAIGNRSLLSNKDVKNSLNNFVGTVYPDPILDFIQVDILSKDMTKVPYQIIDGSGIVIKSGFIDLTQGVNNIRIPGHFLSPGIHTVQFISTAGVISRKFIKN